MPLFETDSKLDTIVVALEITVLTLFALEMGEKVASKLRHKWVSRKPQNLDIITA